MRMLVLGAGRMGLGAVHDLVAQHDVTEVTVADYDLGKAQAIARRFDAKVTPAQIDCNDDAAVVALMRGHASAISCVNYWLNERLARAAIQAGTHFCDLGGNNDVVDAELALDAEARAAGVNVIPDCGLAPGMVAVLAAHGAQ
ncbi:MAG: saccharopine dehydrogenase NADP-binding domain-containing protein, partial [Acidobacteriota bacterium]|nr:saccharopine dehydrogenase NADP-binding domain-containing protein [Acidobacteriota bacterium]